MAGVTFVPLPQVITGWQSPPCAMSLGRNMVNWGAVPPSGAAPACGPTGFSVTIANGPAVEGSAVGQVPTTQSPPGAGPPLSTVEPPAPTPPAPIPPVPALASPLPLPPTPTPASPR